MTMPVRRLLPDRAGSATIEFAFCGSLVVLTLVSSLEVSIAVIAEEFLDQAAERVTRQVRIGGFAGAASAAEIDADICATLPAILECHKLAVDIWTVAHITDVADELPIDEDGEFRNPNRRNTGGAGDIVAVRVYYPWPTLVEALRPTRTRLGDGSRLLMATRIQRNELFASSP